MNLTRNLLFCPLEHCYAPFFKVARLLYHLCQHHAVLQLQKVLNAILVNVKSDFQLMIGLDHLSVI